MDKYITFQNKSVSSIENDRLEASFGLLPGSMNLPSEQTIFPGIITSFCGCKSTIDPATDISNYNVIEPVDDICAICRSKMNEDCPDNKVIVKGKCEHPYHYQCISGWLTRSNDSCPVCGTKWEFENDSPLDGGIIVTGPLRILDDTETCVNKSDLSGQKIRFDIDTTFEKICDRFNIDKDSFKLTKGGHVVEFSADKKLKEGYYGLCTLDSHSSLAQIEINIVDTIKKSPNKIHSKHSTKLYQFKNDVASLLNTLGEKIILEFNGINLTNDLNEMNIFNIGFTNECTVTVKAVIPKFDKEIMDNNFVVVFAKSDIVPENTDKIKNMVTGRISWYPLAHLSTINDADIACFLSSLYIMLQEVQKNNENMSLILKNFEFYLQTLNLPIQSKKSLELLLTFNHQEFNDAHRTMLTMTFHEIIRELKSSSNMNDGKFLTESNVMIDLLFAPKPDIINWKFARQNTAISKTFHIYSPIALSSLICPVLTYDDGINVAIYTEKGKDATHSITLYQPLNDTDRNIDPAKLGKKVAETIKIIDDRIYDEAIMVCIDISGSMQSASDFKEDKKMAKQMKEERNKEHLAIWMDANVRSDFDNLNDKEIREVKDILSWFITHPNYSDWSSDKLDEIVCAEQYENIHVAKKLSENRKVLSLILKNKPVKIGGKIYSAKIQYNQEYENAPQEYCCIITQDLMNDPVILDDGYTYEREEIKTWLKNNKRSPMTNEIVVGKIIPNKSLKSAISNWKDQNKTFLTVGESCIKIIRDGLSDYDYYYSGDDNVYDVMYDLYSKLGFSTNDYKLKLSEGFSVTPTSKLSGIKKPLNLQLVPTKPFTIKLVFGCTESESKVKTLKFEKEVTARNIIYKSNGISWDKCVPYTVPTATGDNFFTANKISPNSKFSESTTIHLFEEFCGKTTKSFSFRRLDIVKYLFDAFINRSISYSLNTCIGLMSFNDKSSLVCEMTPYYENFREKLESLNAHGGTALYDCIGSAIENLNKWKLSDDKRVNTKLRIICLTDGIDSSSSVSMDSVSSALQKNKIIMDTITIGEGCNNYAVGNITRRSGGYIFGPSSIDTATQIMELETMIISTKRDSFNYYSKIVETETPPMIIPKEIKIKSLTIRDLNFKTPTLRLQIELKNIMDSPHPDIDVYVTHHDITFWKVIIAGPEGTPYTGGNWLAYLKFPKGYPNVAPEMRFITPIRHCNVNGYGKICHSIFDRNYNSKVTVSTILQCVYGLLLNPDVTDPIDSGLAMQYYAADGKYEACIMSSVLTAKKSRAQWAKELVD